MKESDLFRAYGMEHDAPIPDTIKCATPRCRGEVIYRSREIFCDLCRDKMKDRLRVKPHG